ncbi:hypothetical protein [Gemmatimonas sp.]|uniref:hypothetical protein n=1 Tax=Gemmatimonas sp. TaxID=1962908 RepID=UPI0025C605CB|nr:hypothetical protein [Gemmatimonas sp.]MCA2991056.1 hypothetical protein [Gemmatimonas sp.]
MRTTSYRTDASAYAAATQPPVLVGDIVRLTLPEPPSFNVMLEWAKQRTRKTGDTRLRRPLPVYYLRQQDYRRSVEVALNVAGHRRPPVPWARWAILRVEFRLWALRDAVELCSSLKWPVDALVTSGWVKNDSPAELQLLCLPEQTIHRDRRGVDLWIRRDA